MSLALRTFKTPAARAGVSAFSPLSCNRASLTLTVTKLASTATRALHTRTRPTPHHRFNVQVRTMSNWPTSISKENPLGLDDPSLFIQSGIIGGQFVDASDGARFDVTDPATGKVIGSCPDMTVEDTRKAIDVAAETFKTFRHTAAGERQKMLLKLHELFNTHAKDIARLIVWENGKAWSDAIGEAAYSASYVNWFAGEAIRQYGDVVPSALPGQRNIVIKQPVGVAALLVPWNFPAGMITRKVAPVIATGCTSVIKVPSETPFTNLAVMELIRRAGVPDGVVNVITTEKHMADVGRELTTNKAIKKVSFTGSTRVGKILQEQASSTLKKMSLELGGNAPLIVFDDADIPTAVAGTIASKFRGSGQTCVCANRIYVHEKVYDEFSAALVEKVKQFKVGCGFDEGVTHGPLIHERAALKVEEHIKDAVSRGAKVLVGGERKGNHMQPTVLGNVPDDCLVTAEETFGPLAALIKFSDEKQVVELANDTDVGLAGYFFSRDSDRIWRVAEALEVGMVGANTGAISQAGIPFGGVKESGYGKEGGYEGTDEYLTKKLIAIGKNLDSPAY